MFAKCHGKRKKQARNRSIGRNRSSKQHKWKKANQGAPLRLEPMNVRYVSSNFISVRLRFFATNLSVRVHIISTPLAQRRTRTGLRSATRDWDVQFVSSDLQVRWSLYVQSSYLSRSEAASGSFEGSTAVVSAL